MTSCNCSSCKPIGGSPLIVLVIVVVLASMVASSTSSCHHGEHRPGKTYVAPPAKIQSPYRRPSWRNTREPRKDLTA